MINQVIDVINKRASVRSYKSHQIDDETLGIILKAGIHAPNTRNYQAWDIVYVQDKGFIDELSDRCKNFLVKANPELAELVAGPNKHIFYNAPTVVFVSGDKSNPYYMMDCALAVENIVLAAKSFSIDSCVIASANSFLNSEDGRLCFELGISAEYQLCLAIALGYSDSDTNGPSRDESKIRKYQCGSVPSPFYDFSDDRSP